MQVLIFSIMANFEKLLSITVALVSFIAVGTATAQQPGTPKYNGPSTVAPTPSQTDSLMVTVVLKHQQDKNLSEIRRILEAQGFWEVFPPDDARVVSWTIAMGLGHVVTLQLPAGAIRRLNLALENGAWGAFDTEVYMTYDYQPVWRDYIEKRADAKEEQRH